MIRRQEAERGRPGMRGARGDRLHFLDLPFYNGAPPGAGGPVPRDVAIVHGLLAGPAPASHLRGRRPGRPARHSPALPARCCARPWRRRPAKRWLGEAELWLYRGAWAEWPLDEIDLAVPLSPQEVLRRRRAIFRHESQKDQALFLGDDRGNSGSAPRTAAGAWPRPTTTSGLAEYEAMEAFRRYAPEEFVRLAPL